MFKPTPRLASRVEARLKGWRGPAVGVLRDETKFTDPIVLSPPFNHVLRANPRNGLPVDKAHKMMGLPMEELLEMRGGRREVEQEDVVAIEKMPRFGEPEHEELELGVARMHQRIKREYQVIFHSDKWF